MLANFEPYPLASNADKIKDVDALGNVIWKDPARPTRNYWGFDISKIEVKKEVMSCLLYTSPSPRDGLLSRMPSSA